MRFPNGAAKALTLSYDDGVEQDIRLMKILDKNGIKCTFNINTGLFAKEGTVYPEGQVHRRMTEKQVVELYSGSGHEVAVHALTHPWLEQLPEAAVTKEVSEDRANIEKLFGKITRGMAYPFGTYSDSVVKCLEACGIVYSRTTRATEDFRIPHDWLRLQPTCHHGCPRLSELADKFVNETPNRSPWLFYLWGHSYEFDGDNNWELIENFAGKVGNKSDIWYAVNIDIYDYVKAYESIVFTSDLSMAYNPSALNVWFAKDSKIFKIQSGETIKII